LDRVGRGRERGCVCGGRRAHTHTHSHASPPSLCLALRRLPRASSAVGRDNSSRRGRRAQGPAEARPRDPAPSAAPTSVDARRRVLLGRHSNPTGGGRGERGPLRRGLDARARRTRPARDLSSRRSPCEAFLVALGCTAHGVERCPPPRGGVPPLAVSTTRAGLTYAPQRVEAARTCGCTSCACSLSCGANHGTVARGAEVLVARQHATSVPTSLLRGREEAAGSSLGRLQAACSRRALERVERRVGRASGAK